MNGFSIVTTFGVAALTATMAAGYTARILDDYCPTRTAFNPFTQEYLIHGHIPFEERLCRLYENSNIGNFYYDWLVPDAYKTGFDEPL